MRSSCLVLLCMGACAWAGDTLSTQLATIDDHYAGGYKDAFPQELTTLRTYITSSQSTIATQLGLQFGQGFHHPVTIRFEDGAPRLNENPFFFVRVYGAGPDFHQELVANVEAYSQDLRVHGRRFSDPRGGFRYAMTQVMLNDLAEGDPDKALPLWLQEGLSVYASGSGPALLKDVTQHLPRSRVKELTGGLNNPGPYLSPPEFARYFLAVDFIASHNVLQTFVQEVTANNRSAADTVSSTFGYEWPIFESKVQDYSVEQLARYAPTDEELNAERSR